MPIFRGSMNKKPLKADSLFLWLKIAFFVLLIISHVPDIEASMVSFYVIETGLPDNGQVNNNSILWENAFMDVFFDAGYIVSNAPVLRLEEKPKGEILRHVNILEAKNAGIDFLLIAQLDFNPDLNVEEISFFIYSVSSKEKLMERQIEGRQPRAAREEYDYMKSIARGLITYIK